MKQVTLKTPNAHVSVLQYSICGEKKEKKSEVKSEVRALVGYSVHFSHLLFFYKPLLHQNTEAVFEMKLCCQEVASL